MSAAAETGIVYCQKCGASMTREDRFCRKCGWDSSAPLWASTPALTANVSDRRRTVAALLCFFLGVFGAHRFYVGKIGTGLLWLFTLGLLGMGMLFDFILVLTGEFKDAEGRKVFVW